MYVTMITFFTLGIIFLFGTLHFISAYNRKVIYPPRKLIKQRAFTLGCGGIFCIIIGILMVIIK